MEAQPHSDGARPRSQLVFPIRVLAAVSASAIFGLVAAQAFTPWSFWAALGLGFGFGTFFIAGTGYRILVAVWHRQLRYAPTSWSGATATSALASVVAYVLLTLNGMAGEHLLLAFSLAINAAYLWVKLACLFAGCCGPRVELLGREVDLRHLEIRCTILSLLVAALAGMIQPGIGASVGTLGHIIVRLLSRSQRGRFSVGWPPLRQPGAELVPLYLVLILALALASSG